eukprot:TRINITY_DN991_c0_g1_i2.p2 TRINITY_DN991_c0_g1~~TRINITY_DN991_c0_g1_i2.p2  ORF type:complete len:175 (+),score=14.86 TRINITY_DN991_c0_g1_i2:1023-1547(+)
MYGVCFRYDINKNKYVNLPELSYFSSTVHCLTVKERYLYVYQKEETMEMLDTFDEEAGWKVIRFEGFKGINLLPSSLKINDEEYVLTCYEVGYEMTVYNAFKRTMRKIAISRKAADTSFFLGGLERWTNKKLYFVGSEILRYYSPKTRTIINVPVTHNDYVQILMKLFYMLVIV